METHEIHVPALGYYLVDESLVISQALVDVIVGPPGALLVKPRAVGLAETMQVDNITVVVLEVFSIDMKSR